MGATLFPSLKFINTSELSLLMPAYSAKPHRGPRAAGRVGVLYPHWPPAQRQGFKALEHPPPGWYNYASGPRRHFGRSGLIEDEQ